MHFYGDLSSRGFTLSSLPNSGVGRRRLAEDTVSYGTAHCHVLPSTFAKESKPELADIDGAVKWVDLCLRSETGNQWCWFELKVRGAGGCRAPKKAALEARDVFRKDVVALMGFDAHLAAETWVNPDAYTKAYWTERLLKPKAPSCSLRRALPLRGVLSAPRWRARFDRMG